MPRSAKTDDRSRSGVLAELAALDGDDEEAARLAREADAPQSELGRLGVVSTGSADA